MKLLCPVCSHSSASTTESRTLRKDGRYYRRSDGQWVQRFWCFRCKKHLSQATFGASYRQKKRHKNHPLLKLLAAGTSQREAARNLCLTRRTVVRKFLFLSEQAKEKSSRFSARFKPATEVEFDDLETFEHTKCKPLSVTLMVEYKTRRILGLEVSKMPAKGKLAAIARKKYGYRRDERAMGRKKLFARMQSLVHPQALIRSDSNPHYPQDVRSFFPTATHETVKGQRGAITGQGELKKVKYDPIFSLNHTCAMLRANINRLFRKTWCTTKRPDRLQAHLEIYRAWHNERLDLEPG